jgi:hypothetical protein
MAVTCVRFEIELIVLQDFKNKSMKPDRLCHGTDAAGNWLYHGSGRLYCKADVNHSTARNPLAYRPESLEVLETYSLPLQYLPHRIEFE